MRTRSHKRRAWLLLIGLCLTLPALADVYQWTDAKGRIHFTDTPPKLLSPYRLGELERPSARARKAKAARAVQATEPRPSAVVKLRRSLHKALQQQRLAARPRSQGRPMQARVSVPESSELCGLYRVSSEQYRARLQDCEGKACEIYQRQLLKFKDKTRRFCNSPGAQVRNEL